jgi:hypothetical protein
MSQPKACKNRHLQAIYKAEIVAICGQPIGITAISKAEIVAICGQPIGITAISYLAC